MIKEKQTEDVETLKSMTVKLELGNMKLKATKAEAIKTLIAYFEREAAIKSILEKTTPFKG